MCWCDGSCRGGDISRIVVHGRWVGPVWRQKTTVAQALSQPLAQQAGAGGAWAQGQGTRARQKRWLAAAAAAHPTAETAAPRTDPDPAWRSRSTSPTVAGGPAGGAVKNPQPNAATHAPRAVATASLGAAEPRAVVERGARTQTHEQPPPRQPPVAVAATWQRRSTDRATATTRVPGVGATESHFQRLEAGGAAARPRPQPRIRAHPARAQHADGRGGGSRQLEMRWKKQEKS